MARIAGVNIPDNKTRRDFLSRMCSGLVAVLLRRFALRSVLLKI